MIGLLLCEWLQLKHRERSQSAARVRRYSDENTQVLSG